MAKNEIEVKAEMLQFLVIRVKVGRRLSTHPEDEMLRRIKDNGGLENLLRHTYEELSRLFCVAVHTAKETNSDLSECTITMPNPFDGLLWSGFCAPRGGREYPWHCQYNLPQLRRFFWKLDPLTQGHKPHLYKVPAAYTTLIISFPRVPRHDHTKAAPMPSKASANGHLALPQLIGVPR